MTDEKLNDIGRWLNTKGYDLDLEDWCWMEDHIQDHSFKDIIKLLDKYASDTLDGITA